MDKYNIQMLDVATFLIKNYNYQRINMISNNKDIWLVTKDSKQFPLIRLTLSSISKGIADKELILKQSGYITNLFNVNNNLLNIHFNDLIEDEIKDSVYSQVLVSNHYQSEILESLFANISASIKNVGEDLDLEFKKRQIKMLDAKKADKLKVDINSLSYGTNILIFLNVLIFIGVNYFKIYYPTTVVALIFGGLYKNLIYGANQWYRLITAGFLHVDFLHILMNMVVLLQLGILVEKVFGKKQMFTIYFISIISSSLLSLIMMDGGSISLGASGGIFGLMGATIVYLITSNLAKIPQIRSQIISTLSINLLISLLPGISFWGHLGGLIGGSLTALAISKSDKVKDLRKHAYASIVLLITLLFAYTFVDVNVYNIKNTIDKTLIASYRKLNLNNYADQVELKLENYYKKIGESYE